MATLDFDAITRALAARLDPANVTPPTGETNIRRSDAYAPGNVTALPHAVTSPPRSGDLDYFDQLREGEHRFDVLVVFPAGDVARSEERIAKWLGVLLNVYLGSIQLGGTVAYVNLAGYDVGTKRYGEEDYPAVLLTVSVVTTDGISPTS